MVLIVVVVPLTVRSLVTVKLPAMVVSDAAPAPIVTSNSSSTVYYPEDLSIGFWSNFVL